MKTAPAIRVFIRFYSREGRWSSLDSYGFTRLLQHCHTLKNLKEIHSQIIIYGYNQNPFISAKLVSQYIDFGTPRVEDARKVFEGTTQRDVLLWNVMIRGYSNSGPFREAIKVYEQMRNEIFPNRYTYPFVLKACAAVGDGKKGREIHGHVLGAGYESDLFVGNALVAFYAKCGELKVARRLFDEIPNKDLVTWNSMIAGYSYNEQLTEALVLFHQMVEDNARAFDRVTLVTVLPVCAQLAAIQQGMWIHSYIIKFGIEIDVVLGSGLIGMYAKCGRLETANELFNRLPERNVVTWNMIIAGHGMHGHAEEAIEMFSQMVGMGVCPDNVSFVTVISACSHKGMVDEGLKFFEMMEAYCVERSGTHYACVVDLLGRAGRLGEAIEFITKMPMEPGKDVWGALLGACRIHTNVEFAEMAAKRLFVLDPGNAGRYVLLAKMYEEAGRWEEAARVRQLMRERMIRKPLGCSMIEINCVIYTFGVEDESHPMKEIIYATLEQLEMVMEEAEG